MKQPAASGKADELDEHVISMDHSDDVFAASKSAKQFVLNPDSPVKEAMKLNEPSEEDQEMSGDDIDD